MTARDTIPDTRRELSVNGQTYEYFSLAALEQAGLKGVSKLPVTLKILLENLLRHKEKGFATDHDVRELLEWTEKRNSDHEISFIIITNFALNQKLCS